MLTVIRKFQIGARVEYRDEVEKILSEFGADAVTCNFHSTTLGGKEIIKVYFEGCRLLANRFDALIERLNEMPIQAGVTLTY